LNSSIFTDTTHCEFVVLKMTSLRVAIDKI
jgi:hypothetical protein